MQFRPPHVSVYGSERPSALAMVKESLEPAQALNRSENWGRGNVVRAGADRHPHREAPGRPMAKLVSVNFVDLRTDSTLKTFVYLPVTV